MRIEIIAACKSFGTSIYTVSQVADIVKENRSRVRHVLWKLEKEGAIVRFAEGGATPTFKKGRPGKEITYRNTKELWKVKRKTEKNGWDKMWKAIRAMRRFTRYDLITICDQHPENVAFFTKHYRKLGYIQPSRHGGRGVVWALIKDPGPDRPIGIEAQRSKGTEAQRHKGIEGEKDE
ncbi:MAG TPA: hypothetical protein DDW17_02030 [Deltaproteobacteria bacterium]|nr:hypothetical protein [Deltaproteobacteria bacterium]